MGSLRELSSEEKTVHLLQTNSGLADIYIYDTLKARAKADLNSIYTIDSRQTFSQMLELVNIEPYLAEKWLFIIEYKKVKSLLKKYKGLFESTSSIFLVKVSNYKEYKEFKELSSNCNDIYLSVIRQKDVFYLLSKYKVNQKLLEFVSKAYYRDVEKVFQLKQSLEAGITVETPKDVTKICGESASTTTRFVFSLLHEMPKSKAGLTRVYKNRMKVLSDIVDSFGPRTAYNYLLSTSRDLVYIKMLYLEGAIYDSVRDIPEVFDEKKLSRYGIYIRRISEEIPYERIMGLFLSLKKFGVWGTDRDAVLFLYNYYLENTDIGG